MADLIKVSTGLSGKMEGMTVITTSMTINPNCEKMSKINGSICEKCYSQTALSYRQRVRECYERNGRILSASIIPQNQLPYINSQFCRLESHGDLINETHLQNYINIVNHNPHCTFALWTKQYKILLDYFRKNPQPDNLRVVISSPMLNKEISLAPFERIGMNVMSFTVYDKSIAKSIDINCGKNKCVKCLRCYSGEEKRVREVVK